MKKLFCISLTLAGFVLAANPLRAQPGMPSASPVSDALAKALGTNLNFTATLQAVITTGQGGTVSMSGKSYYAGGSSRMEMNIDSLSGGAFPPGIVNQMAAMGLTQTVTISQNSAKVLYIVYPGLQAYTKIPSPDSDPTEANDVKTETADLGKDTVDNHLCEKKTYTVTNTKTSQRVSLTIWSATDLKNTPLRIIQSVSGGDAAGTTTTLHFSGVDPSTPAASLFVPPSDYTAYNDVQTMMQTEMMKKLSGGAAPKTP